MGVRAVVFDLDGVLVDSEPVWEEVRRGYVADRGGRWRSDTQQRLMGMSTEEWATYLAEELLEGPSPDDVAFEVVDRMRIRYAERVPLLPGAVEAVRRFADVHPLGLNSSSPRALIDLVLAEIGVASLFRATVSTEEVEQGKPAPDGYLMVAAQLGIPPENCAAIEDSSNGLRSAHAAGMKVIAVPRPNYPPAADALVLATLTADDLDALDLAKIDAL